jgi:hypothetical protein
MPFFECGHCLLDGVIILLDKRPEILGRGPVRQADATGGAGLDGHVADGHPRLHAHFIHHRTDELDHPVSGPIDREFLDNMENDILGVNSRRQPAGDGDPDGLRQAKRATPFKIPTSRSVVPTPAAKAPKAPWVQVWESPMITV